MKKIVFIIVIITLPCLSAGFDNVGIQDSGKRHCTYVEKYNTTVCSTLTDERGLIFSAETKRLKQNQDLYYQLGRLGEAKKDFRPFYQRYSSLIIFAVLAVFLLIVFFIVFADIINKLINRFKLYIKKKKGLPISIDDIDSTL